MKNKITILFFVSFLFLLNFSNSCYAKDKKVYENDLVAVNTTETKLSPNGDGVFDSLDFEISLLQKKAKVKNWSLTIINTQTNKVFDKFSGEKEIPKKISWKGENKFGKIVEGSYKYIFSAVINKKNIRIENGPIIVDVTPPSVSLATSDDTVLADKEQNKFIREMIFSFKISDENKIDKSRTKLYVTKNQEDKVVKEWLFDEYEEFPQSITWNGQDDVYDLVIPEGEYKVVLSAYDVFNNNCSMSLGFTVLEYVAGKLSDIVVKEEPKGLVVNLSSNILFSSGKATLKKEATSSLDETVQLLKAYPANKVLIEGYTDATGQKAKNLQLSYDRAKAVYSYFVHKGIPAERLNAVGYGSDNPVASNKTAKGRAKNRRVKVIILKSTPEDSNSLDNE